MVDIPPVLTVYAALTRARHLTTPALSAATGLDAAGLDRQIDTLSELGWVQPSRDIPDAHRAVNPVLALGAVILDVLDGRRDPDTLDLLGGYSCAAQMVPVWRASFPATYLPTSLDSFSGLIEDAMTHARTDVVSLHTTVFPTLTPLLDTIVSYLHRRGIRYGAVMDTDHHTDPRWQPFRAALDARGISITLAADLPGRGLVIDEGLLTVLHTDTAGITLAPCSVSARYISHSAGDAVPTVERLRSLTVLTHLCEGSTTEKIAAALGVSERTVRRDITVLRQVFDTHHRTTLTHRAATTGLV